MIPSNIVSHDMAATAGWHGLVLQPVSGGRQRPGLGYQTLPPTHMIAPMPVRFVIGRAGCGKTHFLRERLVEHVKPDPLAAKVIYLVPKQATFMTQRAIATDPRLSGYTGIRIASPDELAETALVETGRPAGARLDAAGRSLLIGHLLRQSAGELEHFGRSAGRPGLAGEIDRTFGEFERAGRTPEEFVELAGRIGRSRHCPPAARPETARPLTPLQQLPGIPRVARL